MNFNALVTATEAATAMPGVSVQLISMWKKQGKLVARSYRNRSPLYRWGDLLQVERDTRRNDPAQHRAQRVAA